MPLEPIIGKSETAAPTAVVLINLYKGILAELDKRYAPRVDRWVYTTLGVGVGVVLGMLLGELIF